MDAEKTLRDGLTLFRHSPVLVPALSSLLISRERFDEARDLLTDLREWNPDDPRPSISLASLAGAEGKLDELRQYCLDALALAKEDDDAVFALAGLYLALIPSERARSIELLEQETRLSPEEPFPHAILSVMLELDDPQGSHDHLEALTQLLGEDTDAIESSLGSARSYLAGRSIPTGGTNQA